MTTPSARSTRTSGYDRRLWVRVTDSAYVVVVGLSGIVWAAVEDGARRITARARAKRHRVFAVTRRP